MTLPLALGQGGLPLGIVRQGQRVGSLQVLVAEGRAAHLVAESMEPEFVHRGQRRQQGVRPDRALTPAHRPDADHWGLRRVDPRRLIGHGVAPVIPDRPADCPTDVSGDGQNGAYNWALSIGQEKQKPGTNVRPVSSSEHLSDDAPCS